MSKCNISINLKEHDKIKATMHVIFFLLGLYVKLRVVLFTGREVDELDALVLEAHDLLELLGAPQSDAALVERRQVVAVRRPTHVRLGPVLATKQKDANKLRFAYARLLIHHTMGVHCIYDTQHKYINIE